MTIPHHWPHGHSRLLTTWSFHTIQHMVIPMVILHQWPHGHSTSLTTWSFHITYHMVIPHHWPHGHSTLLTTWPFHITNHMAIPRYSLHSSISSLRFRFCSRTTFSRSWCRVNCVRELSMSATWWPQASTSAGFKSVSMKSVLWYLYICKIVTPKQKQMTNCDLKKMTYLRIFPAKFSYVAFSALTLLVGQQEGHPACKKYGRMVEVDTG